MLLCMCAMALSFSSCEDITGPDENGLTDWYDVLYRFRPDGSCYAIKDTQVFESDKKAYEKLLGKGWECIDAHEICDNGRVNSKSFYSDMYGISPVHIYFEDATTMLRMFFSDVKPGFVCNRTAWSLNTRDNIIVMNPDDQNNLISNTIQLLDYYKWDEINHLWTLEQVGMYGDGRRIYLIKHYRQMSEKELADYLNYEKETEE